MLFQSPTVEERFWRYVVKAKPDDCWEWRGSRSSQGYGMLQTGTMQNPQMAAAHRISYWLHHGELRAFQLVLHKCDNPPCVNPSHLYAGTYMQNSRDCINRGRHRNGVRKLSVDQAKEILSLYSTGEYRQADLAERFGVSQMTISNVVRGQTFPLLQK